jgi:hypothetical protein
MKSILKCPRCEGRIQASRKSYYSWSNGGSKWVHADIGEDWLIYCENDHELGTLDGKPDHDDLIRHLGVEAEWASR